MPLEIINTSLPDISRLPPEQREIARINYLREMAYEGRLDYAEITPSEVIDVNSDAYIRQQEIERRNRENAGNARRPESEIYANTNTGASFDPVRGWIVPYEDPNVLNGLADRFEWGFTPQTTRARSVSREEAFAAAHAAATASAQKAEQDRFASLPPAVRDAEERFGDII